MSDPVKDKSCFLCMYMSNHPDTLVSYAKHYGKLKERIVSAKMISIDSKGMDLTYQVKANAQPKPVRVEFDPPLLGYEEVKPRLLAMKADADEALGTAKTPQISTFRLPRTVWQTGVLVALLIYTTLAPTNDPSPVWLPANALRSTIARPLVIQASWGLVAVAHLLEGLYATSLARKHQMPPFVAASYIMGITVFGYPILFDLRKRIQDARIDSIMKGH
ncbi:hypothetical protein OF83DRAFT_1165454 [Amylostereum chailletii]|nr:hypothetical protein OF83DRAFT_1165454 [Amylostereum chailletii]